MPKYYRKKGTTQVVDIYGKVTTDPEAMKSIGDIGTLPSPGPSMIAQSSSGKACNSCGADLRPNAKFCTKCGSKV